MKTVRGAPAYMPFPSSEMRIFRNATSMKSVRMPERPGAVDAGDGAHVPARVAGVDVLGAVRGRIRGEAATVPCVAASPFMRLAS
jgi:hypothetical protein